MRLKIQLKWFVAIVLLTMPVGTLHAAVTFTGLGDLTGGSFNSYASGVSGDGSVVVGLSNSTSGNEAFRWTASGGMVGLGDLPGGSFASGASAVSNDGSIVVGKSSSTSGNEAFRWTASGGMVGLGLVVVDSGFLASDDGTILGGYTGSGSETEAFRWTASGGLQNLGDLPGGTFRSKGYCMSNDGSVIAGFSSMDLGLEAIRWTPTTGMVGLGHLPGGSFQSVAEGISSDGSCVVGYGSSTSGTEAFRWTASGGMVGLGDLPGGSFYSSGYCATNDGSIVVGNSSSTSGSEAFIWTESMGMFSLKDFLVNDLGLNLSGWTLSGAKSTSNSGRVIVGTGTNPSSDTEAWVASFESISLQWTGAGGGSWDTLENWQYGLRPGAAGQDDVSINPASGLTVSGPAAETTVNSLTIGATSGVAELAIQASLTTTNGLTVQDRGQLTLSGQTVDAGTGLTIDGTGRVAGYGLILGTLGGSTGAAGIDPSGGNYNHAGPLDLGSRDATVVSLGYANLGTRTTLDGGTINVPNGLFIQGASSLEGNGTVNGRIAGSFGSTIRADAALTLGDANSYVGFTSDGELYTGAHEVTINDRNVAVLGSLTQLGDATGGGTLTAGNASTSDTHWHFLVEEGKNLVGRGTINGHFKNNGDVIGDGVAMDERLVFNADWIVSGNGTFTNTLVLGTFAPGDSPTISNGENQAFGGTVQIELGGTTPGSGNDNHDQINDAGTIELLGDSELSILPWNSFVPEVGDEFVIMIWQDGLDGTFGSVAIDSWFTGYGIDFDLIYNNVDGPGNLTLRAVPEPSTLVGLLGLSLAGLLVSTRRGKTRED